MSKKVDIFGPKFEPTASIFVLPTFA